ncbi:hypothetical protein BJ170DRAFT_594090 [Xylariales sp. AK1849]|nr:hypothetical protein BJ170DRAFT_594090 [Xylariales sp. AK1849]
MASFGRSFKPPSYLSSRAARRPGMPGRSLSNMSNASEASSAASSPGDFDPDDICSARPSPTLAGSKPRLAERAGEMHLQLPASAMDRGRAPLSTAVHMSRTVVVVACCRLAGPRRYSPRSSARSRPITIELPVAKKPITSSSSVYTPPAPLSARGDLPGGYFPLHEDQNRVYRSHPFHLDVSKARHNSIQRASQPNSPVTSVLPVSDQSIAGRAVPRATVPLLNMPPQVPTPSSSGGTNTPVASYMPSGVHANPLPMGKYYPSNYENRKGLSHQQQGSLRPPAAGPAAMAVKSDTQVPTYRGDSSLGHSRNESEAKRRLQQYQRDMIAQATLALSGGDVNAAALNAISLRNMGFTSVSGKPSAPKLAPLGSPGPVTPMDLESNDDGYLGIRVRASEDSAPVEEIARAIRAEEERRRREGTNSPSLELGPIF